MDNYLEGLISRINQKEEDANVNGYTYHDSVLAKGAHNHIVMAHDILNDPAYINYNTGELLDNYIEGAHDQNSIQSKINFDNIQIKYNKHREILKEGNFTPSNFDIENLEYYTHLLFEHTHTSETYDHGRHNLNIHRFGGEFYNNIVDGYKYVSDPENNELVYFQVVMGGVWTLIHIGLPEDAIVILDYMAHDFDQYLLGNKESMFEFLGHPAHVPRMGQSLDWAFAWAYRQLDNKETCSYYLNQIMDRHPVYSKNQENEIFWHTGINRILEAAVELYKIFPTEENKTKILSIIVFNQTQECQESFESLRESLFAYYNVYRTLKQ